MARTVFILGAGASVEAGAPLMNNFLDRAQDLLTGGSFSSNPEEEGSIQDVFHLISRLESIHSRAPIDLNNIEPLFGLIEMGNVIKKIGDIEPHHIKYYRDSLITLIARTLEESMHFSINNFKFHAHASYSSFCHYLSRYNTKGNSSSVITFNYDLGLDMGLQNTLGKLDYCLDNESNGFKLMKLHGSINWVYNSNKIEVVKSIVTNSETQIRSSREIKRIYGNKVLPVIVPPTWNKTQYHNQLSNVWNHAANELNTADNLVIIGFSIPETDTFFKYLLGLGLMNGKRIREIIIINKDDSDGIKKRYNDLFGYGISSRLKYITKTFSAGVEYLGASEDVVHFNIPRPSQDLGIFFS